MLPTLQHRRPGPVRTHGPNYSPAMHTGGMSPEFEPELKALLNKHGIDAYCSVADYALAAYLIQVLKLVRQLSGAIGF